MQIEFDLLKRNKTLAERGLDFSRAVEVFNGPVVNQADNRANYGEPRTITFGLLDGRWVVVIWTPRGAARRIISMRYANEREIKRYARQVGRSG
ncbi:BrnT family toxin [Duganella sp. HH101]|uniref:BrnT family toxin n=1 Tax=Duganella sp. HH101 TaxID=1781066 RepID=UPI0008FCC840|nr:BrnT family toxin [Duganella sp. HH101]